MEQKQEQNIKDETIGVQIFRRALEMERENDTETPAQQIVRIAKMVMDKYPQYNLECASGGLVDVKGRGKSDVDLVSSDIHFQINGIKPIEKNDRYIWELDSIEGRSVSIVSPKSIEDVSTVCRSAKHRSNELYINKNYPYISMIAITYKLNGKNTEQSYCIATGMATVKNLEVFVDIEYDLMAQPISVIDEYCEKRMLYLQSICNDSKI